MVSHSLTALSDDQKRDVLLNMAEDEGFVLPEAAAKYLIERSARELSQLASVLARVAERSLREKRKVTLPLVRQVLADSMKVVLTGGGSAGHVTLTSRLPSTPRERGRGALHGFPASSRGRLGPTSGSPLGPDCFGKLRRYFDWKNFTDPFRIALGTIQAVMAIWRFKPDIVFSKGGFAAVPVVVAAWLCRIPVIVHESDVTPGLANQLCFPIAKAICVNFEASLVHVSGKRAFHTGTPLRKALKNVSDQRGKAFLACKRTRVRSRYCWLWGSLGAASINQLIFDAIDKLIENWTVVHVLGAAGIKEAPEKNGYLTFEYIGDEFGDVLAAADLVISRAGANALYELLALKKLHVLIPLGLGASRGDQIQNAALFEKEGCQQYCLSKTQRSIRCSL